MPTTQNLNIPFDEQPPYEEDYDQENIAVTRTLITDWANASQFPLAMLGNVSKNGQGGLTRMLPERHPKNSSLYATKCTLIEGRGAPIITDGGNQLIQFVSRDPKTALPTGQGKAVFKVTYTAPPYAILADAAVGAGVGSEVNRYVIKQTKPGTETYTLPGNAFTWGQPVLVNGVRKTIPIPFGITIRRPIIELRYTWIWIPEPIPWANIIPVVGKVNNVVFDQVYASQTLLCLPPEISHQLRTPDGTPVRNITYVFLYRADFNWNTFFRSDIGIFDFANPVNPVGSPPYPLAVFDRLFVP